MGVFKYTIIMLFAFIGIVSIIKSIILYLCKDTNTLYTLVIPIDNNCDNPEQVIRNAAMYVHWSDKKQFGKIYCIGHKLDFDKREICMRTCEEYSNTEYFDVNNFEKYTFFDE